MCIINHKYDLSLQLEKKKSTSSDIYSSFLP